MPNHLIHETSPYLLQHADNPVDWYPWGPEALAKSKAEDKPIFLSVGYAACHWCHVMAHESFEDPQTAEVLNEHFVSIKVDREERPDIDSIYMKAVISMSGQGGWPMSVFLTPDGQPFYGGTYYPPEPRYGMPAFREILRAVINAWTTDRFSIMQSGYKLTSRLKESSAWITAGEETLQRGSLTRATHALVTTYDWRQGGWGKAPRFPQPMALEFLMMQAARGNDRAQDAVEHNLNVMRRGGMYDVVGGGFHRYSTDDRWLVPHFEKMLYDNAQLALAYLHAYLQTRNEAFRRTCTEALDFVLRELRDVQGGFYSSLDADSEGVEGKYYLWTAEEIAAALPEAGEQELVKQVYDISEAGNFEGKTILQRREGVEEEGLAERLGQIHKKLYAVREQRVRPATDDKVLALWNALTLRALAEAARYLGREDYLEAARQNARFLLEQMVVDGQLMRAWRKGQARNPAYLEDYAGLVLGLLALYQTDGDEQWYAAAERLAEQMQALFRDAEGGFYDTRAGQDDLITRPKDIQDNATPSGNALAALALLHMAAYSERGEWQAQAEAMLATMQELATQHPSGFAMWLQGMDFAIGPVQQVAIVGAKDAPETGALLAALWQEYRPRIVAAITENETNNPTLLEGRGLVRGLPAAYVCQNFTCNLPVNRAEDLQQQLGR